MVNEIFAEKKDRQEIARNWAIRNEQKAKVKKKLLIAKKK